MSGCGRKNCNCIGVDRKRELPPGMKVIGCFDGKASKRDLAELRKMAWFVHDKYPPNPERQKKQQAAIDRIRAKAGLEKEKTT